MTGIERHELESRLEHLERELKDLRREMRNDAVQVRQTLLQIVHLLKPKHVITASVVDVFSGDPPMANGSLVFNVGQTSTDTVTPLLIDGVTPSGGVVSNLVVAASDPAFTAVVNGTNTILFTAVAPSTAGAVVVTRQCTITDTDGAVSQWTGSITVLVNAPVPPEQLTQSVADVFSTPA